MDKLHQIFKLSIPFVNSIETVRYLSLICKSMIAEEEALFHGFLIMLRDNVNKWYLDLFFPNNKLYDYNFPVLHKNAVDFLNFKPAQKIISWKTLAYFLDVNMELTPTNVAAPSLFRTTTSDVALMHHLNRLKDKIKIIKNRMLKNRSNLHNVKSNLALHINNYNMKVKHVGALTSTLPKVLSSMQNVIAEDDVDDFEIQKNIVKKICLQITREVPVIRTLLHELDHHHKMFKQRNNLFIKAKIDYSDAKNIYDRKRYSYLLCVYNANMDMIKENDMKNATKKEI